MNSHATPDVRAEVRNGIGFITLNRPKALNALSLPMIRALTSTLQAWQADAQVLAVAIRGSSKDPAGGADGVPFGAFCAGGDIRFFHQAALAGDPALQDFFTEEYALNHLIHTFGKPYIAFMDGIVMGGGMGISQGATRRIVTARTKMAMPETGIGLFPDVGGGYFLSRCPGRAGEYLALTGEVLDAEGALRDKLADARLAVDRLQAVWDGLSQEAFSHADEVLRWLDGRLDPVAAVGAAGNAGPDAAAIDRHFSLPTVVEIVASLERATDDTWAQQTAATLRKRSPLMLHVVLAQIRRGREMSLAEDLRMELGLVYQCFHLRPGTASETVEGIRALAVDKDHAPRWNPARIEDVSEAEVAAFFVSPWAANLHPLQKLA